MYNRSIARVCSSAERGIRARWLNQWALSNNITVIIQNYFFSHHLSLLMKLFRASIIMPASCLAL